MFSNCTARHVQRLQRCKKCIQASRKQTGRAELYHGWVFYYGNATGVVSAITGKHKSHMWNTLPSLSKSWFWSTSLPSHCVIGHLHHFMFLNSIHQKIKYENDAYDFCLRRNLLAPQDYADAPTSLADIQQIPSRSVLQFSKRKKPLVVPSLS